ncbi:MAG TPA: hypothetical protein VFO50_04760 [Candidatus Limnocylindrales bacterium]|nr:hypothetical protein [Candidatus Limnocylindrales bacterium]
MRSIFGLFRAFVVLTLVAGIASAIAASIAKSRMPSKGEPADDELDLVAIYGPLVLSSTATALRRVSYTAWYGGGTLDLRGAVLDPAGATLTVRALFGGFRLVVPETWRVERHTIGVFGGIGDARKAELVDPNGPLLVIEGFAVFGGVGIVSEAPDLDKAAEEARTADAAAPTESLPIEAAPVPA